MPNIFLIANFARISEKLLHHQPPKALTHKSMYNKGAGGTVISKAPPKSHVHAVEPGGRASDQEY